MMNYKPFYFEITAGDLLTIYEGLNQLMDVSDSYAREAMDLKKRLEEAFRKENNL